MPLTPSNKPPYYITEQQQNTNTLVKSVTITDAQIKTLNDTPVVIIPKPGNNKTIIVTSWIIAQHISVAYTGTGASTDALQLYYSGTIRTANQQISIDATSTTEQAYNRSTAAAGGQVNKSDSNNKSIDLWSNLSNNLTAGDPANYITITVIYTIINH